MKKFLIIQFVVHNQRLILLFNAVRSLIVLISLTSHDSHAAVQPHDSLWIKAIMLEHRFDDARALECYLAILEKEPANIEALVKASRLYCRIGGRKPKGTSKKQDIGNARTLALQALKLSPNHVEARFQYIISMGLLAESADSPREKLENAKIIRREADIVLSIDSNHAGVYYVLGKWHQSISSLTWIERLACDALFGGVPDGASYSDAYKNLQRAIELKPEFILFRLGLAKLYYHQGRYPEAIQTLHAALRLPELDLDDAKRKENCKKLLLEIHQNIQTPKQ
jgi:regulator of microtubule dynamics protein 3